MSEDDNTRPANNRRVVITANTLMPLGVVVAVVLAMWRGTATLESRFGSLHDDIRTANEQLTSIKQTLASRWSVGDMKLWESQLKINNPNLNVPDSIAVYRVHETPTGMKP